MTYPEKSHLTESDFEPLEIAAGYANHLLFCRDYTRNIIDLLQIFVIERSTITF